MNILRTFGIAVLIGTAVGSFVGHKRKQKMKPVSLPPDKWPAHLKEKYAILETEAQKELT